MLEIRDHVREALPSVVALESTLISHGLPWPTNFETALSAESVVREVGATPATIAVLHGQPTIGLSEDEIRWLAQSNEVRKASRRDLAASIADGATAATTVAGTMTLAREAGIDVFATGGIGGVHPTESGVSWDVSADLHELARTRMVVVCAGAKSILDLAATLEVLESSAVPVVGYRTDEFPAFYSRSSRLPVSCRCDSAEAVARLARAHWQLGGAGIVVALPISEEAEVDRRMLDEAQREALSDAEREGVTGAALTPFLLARLAELTEGRTLAANRELIVANARLAAAVVLVLRAKSEKPPA